MVWKASIYRKIIELSSKSYLENNSGSEPHCDISELYNQNSGVLIISGTINGLIGKLFDNSKPKLIITYPKLQNKLLLETKRVT